MKYYVIEAVDGCGRTVCVTFALESAPSDNVGYISIAFSAMGLSNPDIDSAREISEEELLENAGVKLPVVSATNIDYDIDICEVFDYVDGLTAENAAALLEMPYEKYANMHTSERHDWIYDMVRHNRRSAQEILGLGEEVVFPCGDEPWDDDDFTDHLSSETGYCFGGYSLSFSMTHDEMVLSLSNAKRAENFVIGGHGPDGLLERSERMLCWVMELQEKESERAK